jgi:general secretion pathway protein H
MTSRSKAGFTLIEMLVVLAIIALAATALPMLGAGLPGVRLRAEADRIASVLRDLRDAAIRQDATTAFLIDPVTRSYTATGTPPRGLPASVTRIGMQDGGGRSIQFFADGTSTGGTVILSGIRRSAAIHVDWLTGAVHGG